MISLSTPVTNTAVPRAHAVTPMRKFQVGLFLGDVVVVALVVGLGHVSRFGFKDPALGVTGVALPTGYALVSVLIASAWLMLLRGLHTYREILLGTGTEEYARVLQASVSLFGVLAIGSYLFQVQLSRWYFVVVLPLGVSLLLVWRWIARKVLVARRARGSLRTRAVIVGDVSRCSRMLSELNRKPELGVEVVGACSRAQSVGAGVGDGVVVLGDYESVTHVMERLDAHLIIVAGATDLPPEALRRLTWEMDPRSRLVVAPAIVDIAGPRISLRPVDGLPLMEVSAPRMDGLKLLIKRVIDVLFAVVLGILLIPLWIVVSIAISVDDHGPVFFFQPRVGLGGSHFKMMKFRSMRTDAEAVLEQLKDQAGQDAGNGVLFKMKNDPRVTRVGRVLRATSIDELPQLFNVLRGDMSLVGPRPPLPREVEAYEQDVRRKFLVKPGITGLWQVSGRSSLSWEESVRLDLYYVENWSLTGDLQILFRTVKAVLKRDGAY